MDRDGAQRPQEIYYENSADVSWLRPGMLVQFSATLDKRGKAHAPIDALKVFSPREGYQIGLTPESGGLLVGYFRIPAKLSRRKRKKGPLRAKHIW